MRIAAYTYEADYHCPDCTRSRFPAPPHSKDVDENGVDTRAKDSEGNELHPVFDIDSNTPAGTICSDCKAEITPPAKDQLAAWKRVRGLWSHWKYLEAADRAYDAEAAAKAIKEYSEAARKYEAEFFMRWEPNDLIIEIRGGCFADAHNLAPGQRCIVIDHDNLEESEAA